MRIYSYKFNSKHSTVENAKSIEIYSDVSMVILYLVSLWQLSGFVTFCKWRTIHWIVATYSFSL